VPKVKVAVNKGALMKFSAILREAVDAVATNKSRTALTLLGIIIGVGSVITVVGVGSGAEAIIGELLGSYGSTTLLIFPNETARSENRKRYRYEEITREDIELINSEADAVKAVTPQITMEVELSYSGVNVTANLMGTLHQFLDAQDVKIALGRSLRAEDDVYMRKVGVLGHALAGALFGEEDPVGKFVNIENIVDMEVIGVLALEEKSFISTVSELDTSNNNTLFVPVSTVERVGGSSNIYFLIGEAASEELIDDAKRQILSILTMNHGKWDGKYEKFAIQEMGAVLDTIDTVTGTITAFISIIAGIALLVAGIGIMNIMLVSVKERTREIGTRKAVGAKQSSILNQFVLETLMLCGTGGLIGVALAAVVVKAVADIWNWPALISIQVVWLSTLLSLGTGLVFGLYPASKGAKMDPVEALRYE
jgi:putative ABC transport system permease protein